MSFYIKNIENYYIKWQKGIMVSRSCQEKVFWKAVDSLLERNM